MPTIQERRKKIVSQTAIAQQLNVSIGTVSKALRGLPDVKRETFEKVHKAAKSLGYEFNDVEQMIKRSGHGFVVALINESSFVASRSGYLKGLSSEAVNRNLSIISHYLQDSEQESVLNPDKLPWVMQQPGLVRGAVLIHKWPEEIVKQLAKRMPCVSIMHEYLDAGIDFVGVNTSSGISLLMEKLYLKGHTKIGFFGHSSVMSWSRARLTGYTDSLFRMGLELNSRWIIEVESTYPEERERNWDVFFDRVVALAKDSGVTAWMCASDFAGYKLCKGLARRGIKIPDQIAVTGFDSNPSIVFSNEYLSSVKLQSQQMGSAAIRLLLMRDANPLLSRQVLKVDCDLVEGDTL